MVSAHAVPGPKATGGGVDDLKGAAGRIIDVTWGFMVVSFSFPVRY